MTQQTAVEWLIEQVKLKDWQDMFVWNKEEVFERARQMQREQIIKAACYDPFLGDLPITEGEHYYDKTYDK